MSRVSLRIGWALTRFFLRHIFAFALLILLLAASLIGYQIWTLGPLVAAPLLPYLGTCLGLIVVVIVLWIVRHGLGRAFVKGRLAWQKRAAQDALRQGLAQGGEVARGAAEGAQGFLASAGSQLTRSLDQLLGVKPANVEPVRMCPECKRFLRPDAIYCDRCGERLPNVCRKCARDLPAKAKKCAHCGMRARWL